MAFPLDKPEINSTNWGDTVNNNWDTLNSAFTFWSKIVTSTKISITGTASATLNRLHVISGTSADYDITISGLSPSMGDVLGFYVADYGSANKQFRLDAGGSVKIAGRTRYLTLLHTNVVLLMWDGTHWQPLVLNLDTPWVNAGANTVTASTTNPTKGTVSVDNHFWRRVGDSCEVRSHYWQTASGTAGSGNYRLGIPFAYDTSKVNRVAEGTLKQEAEAKTGLGYGCLQHNGVTDAMGSVMAHTANNTSVTICAVNGPGTVQYTWSAANFQLNLAAMGFHARFTYPVIDW